jgi:cytochrome c-type biogenesis protein CcmH
VRHSLPSLLLATTLLVAGWSASPAGADEAHTGSPEPAAAVGGNPTADEHAIASRLLAPCCWNQTLDVHTSDVALNLRREIRTRLAAGESASAVEADLVARYGDRIRAVPDGSPLGRVAGASLVLVALAGLGILLLGLRWRRRAREATADGGAAHADPTPAPRGPDDPWDERLEAELREL